MSQTTYDVLIIGGSLGGVSAALSAGAQGANVCLIEATNWLGGQYTAQGVTKPDDNQYADSSGSTASYRAFRHAVRAFYRNTYTLSAKGAAQPEFNPGGPYPGFTMEPLVGHNVLTQLLAAQPTVKVQLNTKVTAVAMDGTGNAIASVTATDSTGTATTITAAYYLDATDLGDLLPLCGQPGSDWFIGAESQADTGEPNAPPVAHPEWIQPITTPLAIEHRPAGENHTIPEPAEYAQLKQEQKYSIADGYISTMFVAGKDLWSYRSVIAAANFNDPAYPADITMLNMSGNDYLAASIPSGDSATDAAVIARARQASLGYLYWLQTECPRDGNPGQLGYPELKLRADLFNTPDGTSAQPYIRESRRIKAIKTVVQQELETVGPRATLFPDSCGIGNYGGMDVHGCPGNGCQQQFANVQPFQIPLSAFIPVRLTNYLPACKNIGSTHMTNGVYRLHPSEWNIGEASGALAVYSIKNNTTPAAVVATPAQLKDFQHGLLAAGIPLFWWTDVTPDMAAFSAIHLLGLNGYSQGEANMTFQPHAPLTAQDQQDFNNSTGQTLPWPTTPMTRAEAAIWIVQQLGL